jgi:hypothetical protein
MLLHRVDMRQTGSGQSRSCSADSLTDTDYYPKVGNGLPISFDRYINCCQHPLPLVVAEGRLFPPL